MLDTTNPKIIKTILDNHNIKSNKSLGQHFLLSKKVIEKIIQAANILQDDTILEIGPGLGALTMELSRKAQRIIAVEKDTTISIMLSEILEIQNITNVSVINSDILQYPELDTKNTPYKLVANLPYQITSPVLWKFLHEIPNKPETLVIMIQKEVAERLVAQPGKMSLLSVLSQFYAQANTVTHVKPKQFYPPPAVNSSVIKLSLRKNITPHNTNIFFTMVKAGFTNKRKMLKNNLATILKVSEKKILRSFQEANINKKARAQELSIEEWIKLYKVLYNKDSII